MTSCGGCVVCRASRRRPGTRHRRATSVRQFIAHAGDVNVTQEATGGLGIGSNEGVAETSPQGSGLVRGPDRDDHLVPPQEPWCPGRVETGVARSTHDTQFRPSQQVEQFLRSRVEGAS